MNYAQIRQFDVANGEGIRTTIFFSGCNHKCKGCFNSEYWDFNYGTRFGDTDQNKFIEYAKSINVTGISILGGDPFQQDPIELSHFLKRLKEEVNKPIWLWTGYKWGEWGYMYNYCLQYIDVLIDGKYVEELKDYRLKWKGSKNQMVIDVKKTLSQGEIILFCE